MWPKIAHYQLKLSRPGIDAASPPTFIIPRRRGQCIRRRRRPSPTSIEDAMAGAVPRGGHQQPHIERRSATVNRPTTIGNVGVT